jgi:hypothetical protein
MRTSGIQSEQGHAGAPGRHCASLRIFTVVLLGILGCRLASAAGSSLPAEPLEARGKAITQQAFALLSSNLARALTEGGVTNALSYCSIQALPLTKVVADTNRVRLSRVTHKPRNPANQLAAHESAILEKFRARMAEQTPPAPVLITNAQGTVTFYAPILINNKLCLNCHGEPGKDIAADKVAYIKRLYPQDQATGFKMGDLRGLWRIEFLP